MPGKAYSVGARVDAVGGTLRHDTSISRDVMAIGRRERLKWCSFGLVESGDSLAVVTMT
jgi:hypothetical protein